MTTSKTKNKPITTLRDGTLKATLWANDTQQGGVLYSVEFSRSYKDSNDQWQESSSFSNGEILRVARLAEKTYDLISELKGQAKSNTNPEGQ